jgi:hypothetical protein
MAFDTAISFGCKREIDEIRVVAFHRMIEKG